MKDTFKRIKKPQIRRKYFQNTCLIKDFYPKHTKNFWNSTVVKQSTQIGPKKKKTWKNLYACISWYTYTYVSNKHMKRSSSFVIRELQNKTIMRCHYTTIRMAKIPNKIHSTKCYWGFWATGTLFHWWWEYKMLQPLQKIVWQCLTKLKMVLP